MGTVSGPAGRFCMHRLGAKSAKREEIKRINQRVSTRSKTMLKISEKKTEQIITDQKISSKIKKDGKDKVRDFKLLDREIWKIFKLPTLCRAPQDSAAATLQYLRLQQFEALERR